MHTKKQISPAVVRSLIGSVLICVIFFAGCARSTSTRQEPVQAQSLLAKLPSGITLNYRVQGNPDGKPIVLLHGGGDSWHSYDLVYPLLPPEYRVYAITLRGHGWSDHPAEGYAIADFAADIRAFLVQQNLTGVTLVGHSLGSFVAQRVAADDDGRVAKLVLIGSGPGIFHDQETINALLSTFGSLKDPIPYTFARDFQASTINSTVPPAFFETMVAEALKAPADMWHGIAKGLTTGAPTQLDRIKAPTLILWGEKDQMLKREDEDVLVGKIAHSKFIAYPDTGHALHWERPERFATDLLDFIAK